MIALKIIAYGAVAFVFIVMLLIIKQDEDDHL